MTTYLLADDDTVRLLAETRAKYHPVLDEIGVRVSILMAIAAVDKDGNKKGPALKVHGVPALAKVRIVKHSDRVQGMADAEIVVDGDEWAFFPREKKVAILDHELLHLDPQIDEDGKPVTDDGGRPVLKMRHHDHQIGWFKEIAERHGKHSVEMEQARAMFDEGGQAYFPFLVAKEERVVAEVGA